MNSDTLIIIIIFASLGLLVFVFGLSKLYRSLSATSNPLPPVQPLAHHRQTYFQVSKSSLELEYILVDPQPPFHHRPSSSSSISAPRPSSIASESRLSPSPSLTHSSGRIGLPHSPHSQIHLVLPAPLCPSPDSSILPASEFGHLSPAPSTRRPSSSSRPSSRHFLDVSSEYDRRSISLVDRWLPTPHTDPYSLSIATTDTPIPTPTPTQRRTPSPLIPLSASFSSSLSHQTQSRRSIATTLRSTSNSPDPASVSRPTSPNQEIPMPSAITPDYNTIPISPSPDNNPQASFPLLP